MAKLDYRPLGHSGIQVSVVGLGCNQFGGRLDLEGTRAVIDGALAQGITLFDTADSYGDSRSEEFIGAVLKDGRRDEVVLATKFGSPKANPDWDGPRGAPEYIRHACAASLERLQTDVIDLYWYHRPDGITPIGDTLEALDALVKQGVVRAIGASNFSAAMIREADDTARTRGLTRFTAIQNEYNLLHREPEADVLPLCEALDIAFIPYYPLASGLLTGKYRRNAPPPAGARLSNRDRIASDAQWRLVEALSAYAAQRDLPLTDVAIGALLAQPAVASVIAGATGPEQLVSNSAAADWRPSAEDLAALRTLLA